MTRERIPNRWGIAVAAVCMQVCLGAAYGWSVFKNPLMQAEHWSETSVQLNFTLIIVFFGLGTAIGGMWQDRVGPRKVATVASFLYGAGYILAGVATSHHWLTGIYASYGVLAGIGMGIGYVCPVVALAKWFPDKRGLMTGIGVCGYGFGALVMSPFAAWEIIHYGVPVTFWTLGAVYFVLVLIAGQFFANPPLGWRPAGWAPKVTAARHTGDGYTLPEALRTWQLYLLFILLFLNISSGIMVISQASPIAQEMAGMTVLRASGMVGLVSMFNGLGRIFWPWVSDAIGRQQVYFLLYVTQVMTFFCIPRIHDWTLFAGAFALVGLCYGGGLGTMPSFVADYFGHRAMGGIYGTVLFVGNLAAIPSPMFIAHVHEITGMYAPALRVVMLIMLFALILPPLARHPLKHKVALVAESS
jgi:OFA family oxalate/formate antiporter-like MFS transporter